LRTAPSWLTPDHLARQIAFWLFHHHPHGQYPAMAAPVLQPINDPMVQKAVDLIPQYLDHPQAVQAASEAAGINRHSFIDKFRAATGLTPMDYLQRLKIERAKVLLQSTSTSVTDIAGLIGYDSLSHFIRKFRFQTGMTPKVFRELRG
jgi:transcriptional regulator GlxA family with amidase domain